VRLHLVPCDRCFPPTSPSPSLPLPSSHKNKAKGSNIGDAIVELLLTGGMPASVIEVRLVEAKKLEQGAAGNLNKCVCCVCGVCGVCACV